MTNALIQTIKQPSGHSPGQQVLSGKTAPTESRARVQILTTQPHIPDPATHSHSLLRVQEKSHYRKTIETIFYDLCTI